MNFRNSNLNFRIWNLVPITIGIGAWSLELGAWSLELGAWSLNILFSHKRKIT